jgi:hypothetical protein
MTSRPTTLLPCALLLAPLARAQAAPDVYVCDSEGDKVWLCADLDGNGDYNGATEAVVFYDDLVGPVALSVNAGLWRAADGALFVTDSTEDVVLRLVDIDGNGDAHGANEATIWFDGRTGGNASGVLMTSARGMWRDPDGVLWVASSNVVSGGNDAILRLEDVNGNGHANDLNEALEYYVIAPGAAAGVSIPSAIVRGADGALYYSENGTSANPAKGAYRLEDLDQSGTIDQPNEVTPYFIAPPQGGTPFHWEITIDAQGKVYLGDNGNEVIWKLDDANNNGVIDAGEERLYWQSPVASNVWDIDVDSDGSLYLVEDQTPDRLVRLYDVDGNGVIDPVAEAFELYSDLVSGNDLGSPRALALVKGPLQAGTNYCGPAVINSTGASATMSSTGSASVAANDLVLVASDLPQSSFGYFLTSRTQGFIANPGGSLGNLCLGAPIGRYVGPGQIQNSGAAGAITLALDLANTPTPTGLVAVQVGEVWSFTAWFRDSVGGVAVSNFADGYEVTFE